MKSLFLVSFIISLQALTWGVRSESSSSNAVHLDNAISRLNSSEIWSVKRQLRDISCPISWINPMGWLGKSCYYFPTGSFSGNDAHKYCQQVHSSAFLINARTSVELDALKWIESFYLYKQPFWVYKHRC